MILCCWKLFHFSFQPIKALHGPKHAMFCPIDFSRFEEPQKRISDAHSLKNFDLSQAQHDLKTSLMRLVQLVQSKDTPDGVFDISLLVEQHEMDKYPPIVTSRASVADFQHLQHVQAVLQVFADIRGLVSRVPPVEGPRRYGNLAYRQWYDVLQAELPAILAPLQSLYRHDNFAGLVNEASYYLNNSFGNRERMDFGTGHELNFLAFFTALWKVDILPQAQLSGEEVLIIFGRYYDLVRTVITTYTLEPAGSHGVWGLDDHFHISYILGASQLITKTGSPVNKNLPAVSPKFINNKSMTFQYSHNFFFNSVLFVYKVKKSAFYEHSPILYDISSVRTWDKVLSGLLKMYKVEVFNKFPVVQHFYFGECFKWCDLHGNKLPVAVADEINNNLSIDSVNAAFTKAPWKR